MRRIYPGWVTKPYNKVADDLAETLGRIADRTDQWKLEEIERSKAFAWCRANGNPHLTDETTDPLEDHMPSEQEQSVEPDMSWFDIAVDHKGEAFVLGASSGWEGFAVEHHWEDTFDCDEPSHLKPGAYRWSGFKIGHWSEDEHLNIVGGHFTPILTPEDEANTNKALAQAGELEAAWREGWEDGATEEWDASDKEAAWQKSKTRVALSTPAPDKALMPEAAVGEAASMALMYLETGFIECERCGDEIPTKTLDAVWTLREAGVTPAPNDVPAMATPTPVKEPVAKLTAEYLAMTPLQKWDTLALHGLLGTDEPWIEDMRQSLRGVAATNAGQVEAKLDLPWLIDATVHAIPDEDIRSIASGTDVLLVRGRMIRALSAALKANGDAS